MPSPREAATCPSNRTEWPHCKNIESTTLITIGKLLTSAHYTNSSRRTRADYAPEEPSDSKNKTGVISNLPPIGSSLIICVAALEPVSIILLRIV